MNSIVLKNKIAVFLKAVENGIKIINVLFGLKDANIDIYVP